MKTEHVTGRSTHAYVFSLRAVWHSCFTFHVSSNAPAFAHGLSHVCRVVKNLALAPQSFCQFMSCRNLLGLPQRRSTFPDGLETESGIPCTDPSGGGWFVRVAQQSPLTGHEPKRSPANTRRSTFLRGETVSIPTSTTRPPLPRLTTQTPWMRE